MKQRIELSVESRETGKHFSRSLRKERKVPAVIYGAGKNTNVYINEGDVVRYNTRAYENALFNLKSSNEEANGKVVLIKDVDVHSLSRRPQHVDLLALDMSKEVKVSVEIKFEGKPIGLSEGGLLNIVNRQIEVECLPSNIPESISVDISNLGVGDALHVSDLVAPEGVKVITGPEITLAVVNLFEEESVASTGAATPAAAAAAPAAATPAAAGKASPAPAKK